MNTTNDTQPPSPAAAVSRTANTKQPRKRRMAREPKENAANVQAGDPKAAGKLKTPEEPRGPTKIATVIALLERSEGATLAEMVEATGWLPHTTRAALTGLKKKGHSITKDKRDDVTCYRIAKAAE
jgi:hypothetical protein